MYERRIFSHHTQLEPFIDAICNKGERPPIPPLVVQTTPERRRVCRPQPAPDRFVALMTRCWDADPRNRPSFPEILDELDAVLLLETITNADAMAFWSSHFAKPSLRTEVPWNEFVYVLTNELGVPPAQLQQLFPIICARESDLSRTVDFVSMRMLNYLSMWFGPFFLPHVGPPIIAQIGQLVQQPWFHWDLKNKEAADGRLLRRANGTFLIRVSYTDPAKKPFTLSYIADRTPEHVRIAFASPGKFTLTDPTTKEVFVFSSLQEFVAQQMSPKSALRLTNPCPRECYSTSYGGY